MIKTATIPPLVKKSETEKIPIIGKTVTLEEFNSILSRVKGVRVPLYYIKGYTKEHMEELCFHAYKIFIEQKFKEAILFFRTMILFNHLDMRGWIGIAGCYQSLKNYKEAIKYYLLAAEVDSNDPRPFFGVSRCYMELNDNFKALDSMEKALLLCGDNPQYDQIKKNEGMLYEAFKTLI